MKDFTGKVYKYLYSCSAKVVYVYLFAMKTK